MVATVIDLSPELGTQRESTPKGGAIAYVSEMDDHIRDGLTMAAPWIAQAHTAFRYYRSDQYRRRVSRRDKNRIRLVANFIRRDVDLIVSEVLDGKPVVNPIGRHPGHYELGRQLLQILEWSRDEEETWDSTLERVITSCVHIGEGVLFEGWDQDVDGGRGRPVSVPIDARYVLWDETAEQPQRDDAEWIAWIQHVSVKKLEERYPKFKDKIQPETYETFLVPSRSDYHDQYSSARSATLTQPSNPSSRDEKAWLKRQWTKKVFYEKSYFYKDTGELVKNIEKDEEGEDRAVPLTEFLYAQLSPQDQALMVNTRRKVTQVWESTAINDMLVEHHLSPFDESKGGHGKYPFAFFSYEILPDEHRARGEIGFLMSMQDITNETVTQVLEQLFINNVGYWQTYSGAMRPEEREKLNRIAYEPNQVIETQQGVQPPQHMGVDPAGLSAAMSAMPFIKDLTDKTSGIHDVDRGQVPGHIQSGRAIRALQAKTSRLNIKTKRHVESGLRRATLLRIYNLMQFMRGPRVLEVTDPRTQKGKMLYIGYSEMEIASFHDLQPKQDQEGNPSWVNPQGQACEMMVLNSEVTKDIVFERVKLTLDTGQEANRLERMDQAEMVLKVAGPAALPWAAKELEWNNMDELLDSIEKRDEAMQTIKMGEDFEKEAGMKVQDALKLVLQTIKGQGGGAPPGGPGQPGAGGMPQGAPPMPAPPAGAPA